MNATPLSLLVPGLPHILLSENSGAVGRLQDAFAQARQRIAEARADFLMLYSTSWISVLGHQIQARQQLSDVHVDQEFHMLGSIPYTLNFSPDFANAYKSCAEARGLHARLVDYHGFPVDTGTLVALKLLNPNNELPVCVVSCNMYADRAETIVLGKAARDALEKQGKRAAVVAVSGLSMRMFPKTAGALVQPNVTSLARDDEWNAKILELLGEGRVEEVTHLSRRFHKEACADQKFKAIWWLSAVAGSHNSYTGEVLGYEALEGTGAAVVALTPCEESWGELEFDEEDVETFRGERQVLVR